MTGFSSVDVLGPVTLKEMGGIARRWETYLARVLYIGFIGLALYPFWYKMTRHGSRPLPLSEYASLGRVIFNLLVPFQILFAGMTAVLAAADRLSGEMRRGTLDLLLLSPLTVRQIVVGKWKAVLLHVTLIILAGLPAAAICLYLGGVGYLDVARSFISAVAWAAAAAALALSFSAAGTSGAAAALVASLILFASVLAPALFTWALGREVLTVACLLHPAYAGLSTTLSAAGAPAGVWGLSAAAVWLAGAFVLLRRAERVLERRARREPDAWEAGQEIRTLAIAERHDAGVPRTRVLSTWRVVWDDCPLLWKEFVTRPALRVPERWRRRIAKGLFALILVSWFATLLGRQGDEAFLAWGSFFVLLALLNGTLLFAPERAGRISDPLLTAPLTSWALVRAKLLAGVIAPESLLVLGLCLLSMIVWCVGALPQLFLCAALFLGFAFLLGAWSSLGASSPRGALTRSVALLGLLLGGLPAMADYFRPTIRSVRALRHAFETLLPITNPAYLIPLLERPHSSGRIAYDGQSAFLAFCAVYLAANVALLLSIRHRFHRAVRLAGTP